MTIRVIKVVIESRPDGGAQVYSNDLPGLILSGCDRAKVLASIAPAAQALLAHRGITDKVRIDAEFVAAP